jgi:hypothetical protein
VIVDEAQDLHPARWRLLSAVTAAGSDDLFIVGDPNQRIYDSQVSLASLDISVRGRSRRLTHQLPHHTRDPVLGGAGWCLAFISCLFRACLGLLPRSGWGVPQPGVLWDEVWLARCRFVYRSPGSREALWSERSLPGSVRAPLLTLVHCAEPTPAAVPFPRACEPPPRGTRVSDPGPRERSAARSHLEPGVPPNSPAQRWSGSCVGNRYRSYHRLHA